MKGTSAALAALALAIGAFSAGGCGSGGGAATASGGHGGETTTIRYQTGTGIISPLEVADELGYLGRLSIKSVGAVIGGPQDIQAVATDQSDIGGAFNGAIVKLVAAGAPVKAVVGYYGTDAEAYMGFYVLDGSPIRSARDLIGKKIGVNTLGAHAEAVTKMWLAREGLSEDEIDKVELVVIPPINAEQSLRQGQLDAVQLNGALRDLAVDRGGVRPIFRDYDLLGDFTAGSLVLRDTFITDNPRTTRTLVAGLARAVDYLQTQPRAKVIALADRISRARDRPEDLKVWPFWRSQGVAGRGGAIAPREFSTWVDWMQQQGELKPGQVDLRELYTNQFNPYAGDAGE